MFGRPKHLSKIPPNFHQRAIFNNEVHKAVEDYFSPLDMTNNSAARSTPEWGWALSRPRTSYLLNEPKKSDS